MALNRYTVEALRSGERARLTCWRLRLRNREVFLVAEICEQPHLRCLGQGAKRCTQGGALPSIFAFILVINPGDLRVAEQACGLCHGEIIRKVDHSMMNHGAMLWGAALYNNGGFYLKNYRFGQAYGADGAPLRLANYTPVTPQDTCLHGILPFIEPLPRFNLSNPGNILRIFEKG